MPTAPREPSNEHVPRRMRSPRAKNEHVRSCASGMSMSPAGRREPRRPDLAPRSRIRGRRGAARTAVVPPATNQSSPLTRTTSAAPPAARTIALPGQPVPFRAAVLEPAAQFAVGHPARGRRSPNRTCAARRRRSRRRARAWRTSGRRARWGGCRLRRRARTTACRNGRRRDPAPPKVVSRSPLSVAGRAVPPSQSLSSSGWKIAAEHAHRRSP